MPADRPGRRLKVLASGLHQLGTKCEKITAELAADAVPSFAPPSGWQSTAASVNIAATAAGKDLSVIGERIGTQGTDYSNAGTMYTDTDDVSAGQFRGLVD